MKKIVIVFISLILIVPASGQIYLEQVYPPDIGKPERDYPAYFGCIDYGKEGGDLSIVWVLTILMSSCTLLTTIASQPPRGETYCMWDLWAHGLQSRRQR